MHAVPVDALRQLPESLADPIAVFQSRTESDSLVVLTQFMEGDRPIIIAVALDKSAGKGFVINRVASMYGKSRQAIAAMFGENVLYENTKKASSGRDKLGSNCPSVRLPYEAKLPSPVRRKLSSLSRPDATPLAIPQARRHRRRPRLKVPWTPPQPATPPPSAKRPAPAPARWRPVSAWLRVPQPETRVSFLRCKSIRSI